MMTHLLFAAGTASKEAAETTASLLEGGAIMLGAAIVFILIFRKLGLGATLGTIIAGIIIGPEVLGLVKDPENLAAVSEIGIAILLFVIGLELQPSRLWRLRSDIFGLGGAQVLISGLVLSGLFHLVIGTTIEASLAIGMSLALSSTAQILPMLKSQGELHHRHGERAFSTLLFQDMAIVPLITLIAALSRAEPDPSDPTGWTLAGYTVGAVVLLILVGRYVMNPLFRLIGRMGERELFVAAGLFTVLAASALMHVLGLSVALGAFVAGVMLAESPYRHELESDVEPFRAILLGLFFLSVGMLFDLQTLLSKPLTILAIAVGVIIVKTGVIMAIGRAIKMSWKKSLRLGLLLSQAGEFGFVLFAQAVDAQLLYPEAQSMFGAVIVLTMAATPFLMKLIDRIDMGEDREASKLSTPDEAPTGSVIVVGYGRFGQTVAQMLMAKSVQVTLVDTDATMIERAEEFGTKVYFGDGTRVDLLRQAGAEQVEAILFCNDKGNESLTPEALERVLEAFPQAAVLVRAFDRRHLMDLHGLDLTFAQREMFESAVVMGRQALKAMGIEGREIERVEREYRKRDEERLIAQKESGDIKAKMERSFSHDRSLADEEQPG